MTAMTLSQPATLASSGASEIAGFIAKQLQQGRQHLLNSYTFGQQASNSLNELYDAYKECQRKNWDGYDAMPVSPNAFNVAYEFIQALPLGMPAPSIGAEPDGHLTLEWYRSPRRMLSVSASPDSELHYAALIGTSKRFGTEPFYGEVPRVIAELIQIISAS